jgi:hypothetical protein
MLCLGDLFFTLTIPVMHPVLILKAESGDQQLLNSARAKSTAREMADDFQRDKKSDGLRLNGERPDRLS